MKTLSIDINAHIANIICDIAVNGNNSTLSISFDNNSNKAITAVKFNATGYNSSHNSGYTVCTGSVKNTGNKTYKYIEVKGSFKDSAGNVIDTDWTYAAGSEGLSPNESTT